MTPTPENQTPAVAPNFAPNVAPIVVPAHPPATFDVARIVL